MKSILALGMFDGMHDGHKRIIEEAKRLSTSLNAKLIATTFSDEMLKNGLKGGKCLFFKEERVNTLYQMGADDVFVFEADVNFLQQSKIDFLNYLNSTFDLAAIVVGNDFLFGKNREGTAEFLKVFFESKGILVNICDILLVNGKKISSSELKKMIKNADFYEANRLLLLPYQISGVVKIGRGDGKKNFVPTMNIDIPDYKILPPSGVYYTHTIVDDTEYQSVTNLGSHPTYLDETENIETHLLNAQGDFYGKKIQIRFCKKLRDIMQFSSPEELRKQIEQDIQEVLSDKIWCGR